jgi:hypothetical protein
MNDFKATPEQWNNIEGSACGRNPFADDACLLELRSRVEALEAQAGNLKGSLTSATPPTVATNDELIGVYNDCPEDSQKAALRDVYDLGIKHGQASSREAAEPAPVAGDMAKLVAELRIVAAWAAAADQFIDDRILTRAADTLQRLSEQEAGQ